MLSRYAVKVMSTVSFDVSRPPSAPGWSSGWICSPPSPNPPRADGHRSRGHPCSSRGVLCDRPLPIRSVKRGAGGPKVDIHPQSAAGPGLCPDEGVVRVGDRLDDGETEPHTVVAVVPMGCEPLPRLKEAL